MKGAVLCGVLVLVSDAVLTWALWAGLVLLRCSSCGGLAAAWGFAAVKWVILSNFARMLTDGKQRAVLARLTALLCFLSPAFESGRVLVAPPSEPSADLSILLLAQVSSLLACAVWESGFCAYGKKEKSNKDRDSWRLLLRLLKYFKPDTLWIVAAFSFLIFTVICEFKTIFSFPEEHSSFRRIILVSIRSDSKPGSVATGDWVTLSFYF